MYSIAISLIEVVSPFIWILKISALFELYNIKNDESLTELEKSFMTKKAKFLKEQNLETRKKYFA